MKTKYQMIQQIEVSECELSSIEKMSDNDVCVIYNVDFRSEIVDILKEDIETLKVELEEINKPNDFELELSGEKFGFDYY